MGYSLSASYYLLKPLSLHQADFEEAMELCQLKPPYEVTVSYTHLDVYKRQDNLRRGYRLHPVSDSFRRPRRYNPGQMYNDYPYSGWK